MKSAIFLLIISLGMVSQQGISQGCVAIRSTGNNLSTIQMHSDTMKWQLGVGFRYYESFRHFVGTEEQKERLEKQNEVINHSYTVDLSIMHHFNDRWSILFDLPLIFNTRSQVAKWDGSRYQTHSYALHDAFSPIGDMKISAYRWMIDPRRAYRGNIQLGAGIKLPTGNSGWKDDFPTSATKFESRPVDQSIQPGDGGLGISLEANWYYNFSYNIGVYGNGLYLLNSRDQNGVLTYRSNQFESVMSVTDQYMGRIGANYMTDGDFSFSLGGRVEGIPTHDLVGASNGFRRPGYIISGEPGINYIHNKSSIYASVPVALLRNRTQSIADIKTTDLTGKYTQGDAAFADYVISIGYSLRF